VGSADTGPKPMPNNIVATTHPERTRRELLAQLARHSRRIDSFLPKSRRTSCKEPGACARSGTPLVASPKLHRCGSEAWRNRDCVPTLAHVVSFRVRRQTRLLRRRGRGAETKYHRILSDRRNSRSRISSPNRFINGRKRVARRFRTCDQRIMSLCSKPTSYGP
jgi:hypothetical protein